jgi:hypothetical protein
MSHPGPDGDEPGGRAEDRVPRVRMRGSTVLRLGAYILVTVGFFAVVRTAVTSGAGPRPEETSELGVLADPRETYDPVRAGEPLPPGFRQLLRRDAILPVYDPEFLPAAESGWDDDTLVIGLDLDGEAKAYPIRFLNRREMVVDSIAGIPVLVTW